MDYGLYCTAFSVGLMVGTLAMALGSLAADRWLERQQDRAQNRRDQS
jgi:hypothetical protein